MLKAKRSFEAFNSFPPEQCSPARHLATPSSKRTRYQAPVGFQLNHTPPSQTTQVQNTTPSQAGYSPQHQQQVAQTPASPLRGSNFPTPQSPLNLTPILRVVRPKREASTPQKLFTVEEVQQIVQRAISEREAQLREEYDSILQERLAEQFQNFAKFNQDCVSRQLRQSHFDYMS
eukprot:GFYU01002858.1.p1 GENE.GFYU01002858.1~~GFYU01002858.1.p1  ORF type:complete len:175 (-),score=15.09 GFYU01002858.1:393-917(-)